MNIALLTTLCAVICFGKTPVETNAQLKHTNSMLLKALKQLTETAVGYDEDIDGTWCSVYARADEPTRPYYGYHGFTVDNGCCQDKYTLWDDERNAIGCC